MAEKGKDGKEHVADGPQMDHPDVVAANEAHGVGSKAKPAKSDD